MAWLSMFYEHTLYSLRPPPETLLLLLLLMGVSFVFGICVCNVFVEVFVCGLGVVFAEDTCIVGMVIIFVGAKEVFFMFPNIF